MANTKVTGALIADATITATNIADGAVTAAKLTGITTTSIAEGDKLFYTDARVGTYLSTNGYDTAANIIATITDSAPATLDTLNELAAALGDDPNYATTTANLIGTKLPLAGGTLTGTLNIVGPDEDQLRLGTAATERYQIGRDSTAGLLHFYGTQTGYTGYVFGGVDGERMRIKSNGDIKIQQGVLLGFSDFSSGTSGTGLVGVSGENLLIYTAGAEKIRIDSSGNVRINSTSGYVPNLGGSTKFKVTNNADENTNIIIENASNGTSASAALVLGSYGADFTIRHTSAAAGGDLIFSRGTTERLRVNSSGNLLLKGTGTTSLLKFDSSSYGQIQSTGNTLYYDVDTQIFRSSAGSEAMRIDSSGNVGIGNTSPGDKLVVSDGGIELGGTNAWFKLTNGGANTYINEGWGVRLNGDATHPVGVTNASFEVGYISNGANRGTGNLLVSGNVGIGTTSPSYKLDVNSTSGIGISVANGGYNWLSLTSGYTGAASIGINDSGGSGNLGIYQYNSSGAYVRTAVRLTDAGNLGIGTTSPSQKLHINGASAGLNFSGGNNRIYFNDHRALEGSSDGATLQLGEGYGKSVVYGKLLVNRTSGDKTFMVKTGSTASGVHFVAGFGGANYTTGYAVGIGLDPEGYDGRNKIGIVAEGNSTGWSTGKMHFLVKGGVGDSTEASLAESRMTIDNVGRVSIGTTSTDAKFHVEQGAIKHGSSHNSTFAAVKRFYQAQSSFNNPDIEIISSASGTSSYPQISVHIKMHGRGLSQNYTQYTEAIATVNVSGSTLTNLTQQIISHTTIGPAAGSGTFSISGGSLYYTPNRQSNYDGYTLEVRINSVHCTYNY